MRCSLKMVKAGLIGAIEQRRRLIHRADAAQFLGARHRHDDVRGRTRSSR